MRVNSLPDFRPSVNGFRFPNRWPAGPAFQFRAGYVRLGIGEVADGLCGGMCIVAADRYLAGEPVPPDEAPPDPDSPLFRYIARRQLDSLDRLAIVPFRFWLAAAMVAAGRWSAARQVAEWQWIRGDIDAGRPSMVGPVRSSGVNPLRLTANHQVLGYGYEATMDAATLRIYDPNHPGVDDVEIRIQRTVGAVGSARADGGAGADGSFAGAVRIAAGADRGTEPAAFSLEQSTGEPLLAILRLPFVAGVSR